MNALFVFLKTEQGAASVEYGILACAVAAGIIAIALIIGSKVNAMFASADNLIP